MRALGFLLLCVLHGDAFFNIPSIPSPTTRNLAGLFSNLGGRHPVRSATLRLAPRPSKVGIRGGSMVASSAVSSTDPVAKRPMVPISVISGFLGAGKTTMLQQILSNKGGIKVGVVVNDLAAVNIDSKLVMEKARRSGADPQSLVDDSDVVELQNGCACCSASDELLMSVLKLLNLAIKRGDMFDRIVVEMSGVAEPKQLRKHFWENAARGHPVFEFAELQNMVTVVDAANFLDFFQSTDDLEGRGLTGPDSAEDPNAFRKVVDLLTQQVEVADYVVLNKADKVDSAQMDRLRAVVTSLNPGAAVEQSSFGKVDLKVVLGSERAAWVAKRDDEDDLRGFFEAAYAASKAGKAVAPAPAPAVGGEKGHEECDVCDDHGHEGGHAHEDGHAHGHAGGHANDEAQAGGHAHGDGHAHDGHAHAAHEDGHAHAHAGDECHEPGCTDPSHAHAHGAEVVGRRESDSDSPESKFGITSFVYSRRRPFHPGRLKEFISKMPIDESPDIVSGWAAALAGAAPPPAAAGADSPLKRIYRSKGFVWMSTFHRVALVWSQAGRFFDLNEFGMYWASTPRQYWPDQPDDLAKVISDFSESEAEFGDRRQEIVFIGVGINPAAIEAMLDPCLFTDQEMEEYRAAAATLPPDMVRIDWSRRPPAAVDSDAALMDKLSALLLGTQR